ncbi:hypothetical protein L596_007348 [Steinernema carpocapsae]|uniref:Uncharacterized protein n=1 Tax=Steinernema carpocapsae TaxID=34508 RepID=A0A4U5P9P7_STECR|nr:hypothetical protein L596_007348 [Steinernema carpocapsae]
MAPRLQKKEDAKRKKAIDHLQKRVHYFNMKKRLAKFYKVTNEVVQTKRKAMVTPVQGVKYFPSRFTEQMKGLKALKAEKKQSLKVVTRKYIKEKGSHQELKNQKNQLRMEVEMGQRIAPKPQPKHSLEIKEEELPNSGESDSDLPRIIGGSPTPASVKKEETAPKKGYTASLQRAPDMTRT